MRWLARAAVVPCLLLLVALVYALPQPDRPAGGSNQRQAEMVPVIFTAAPVYASLAALHGEERFPQGAQLMVLHAGHAEPFVSGFAASADASISFDGKTVLFAGKKDAGDRWGIWEVPAEGGESRLVRAATTDLIRPFWMPEGRLVYARRERDGFALEAVGLDGSAPLRLSYLPGNFVPDDVLRDGRVLFESGFPLGAGAMPEMFLVYADGSGVESVRCDHGAAREHGRQMGSGDIVFAHGPRLARFTSALAEDAAVGAPAGEYAGDVAEMPDGRWLVAARKPGAKHFGLGAWKPGAAAVRAETLGGDGKVVALGTTPVEKDGSFFVQAAGDRPLRFILLDAAGHTLREEHGWFWVRRGEQRICVGCHTGPERAPENRVPQVLLRTTTPADMTGGAASAAAGGR